MHNSSYRKFDGVLRRSIAAMPEERASLPDVLDAKFCADESADVARAATITRLVFERQAAHLHFIDAAGGGYARGRGSPMQAS